MWPTRARSHDSRRSSSNGTAASTSFSPITTRVDRRRPSWTAVVDGRARRLHRDAAPARARLLAVAGAVLSLGVVLDFLVPAILNGKTGLLVALVGAPAVMFITL